METQESCGTQLSGDLSGVLAIGTQSLSILVVIIQCEKKQCVDPMVVTISPRRQQDIVASLLTAAPSAKCNLTVDIGDRQTDIAIA